MEGENGAENEFREVDLGDLRRTHRLMRRVEERGDHPNGSIATRCGSPAVTKAAYRFLEIEAVGAESILESYYQASAERAAHEGV
jgi:hypothetical protein